ncbi:hypothetical protein Hanom_Chr11g00979811 [Helianthus anomalus]
MCFPMLMCDAIAKDSTVNLPIYGLRTCSMRRGLEEVSPGLREEEVLKTFFNEITFKKQTHCRLKRLRVVCLRQT